MKMYRPCTQANERSSENELKMPEQQGFFCRNSLPCNRKRSEVIDEMAKDEAHPGNMPFPHDHEWKNGERGKEHLPPDPSYKMSWEPVIGAGLVVICTVGIIAVAADDLTGVGVADDFLFGPLGAGVGEGLIMIFG